MRLRDTGLGVLKIDNSQTEISVDLRPSTVHPVAHVNHDQGTCLVVLRNGIPTEATLLSPSGSESPERHCIQITNENPINGMLNEANHGRISGRLESLAEMDKVRLQYLSALIKELALVEDTITGNKLQVGAGGCTDAAGDPDRTWGDCCAELVAVAEGLGYGYA